MRAKRYSPKQLNQIVKDSGILLPNGQVKLTKPLKVFKKVYVQDFPFGNTKNAIANLIIPIGAIVNLCCEFGYYSKEKKFRASQAYCHSIFSKNGKIEYEEAFSGYNASFRYYSGKKMGLTDVDFEDPKLSKRRLKCKAVPVTPFCKSTSVCAPGIHFFQQLGSAKNY